MAESTFDHDPGEQRLRVAARLLDEGQKSIAQECDFLLMALNHGGDLDDDCFFRADWPSVKARRADLCRRAARAAMAVLLADDGVDLPDHIATAFDMPQTPSVELARLVEELRALCAQTRAHAAALAEELAEQRQRAPSVARLIELARQAHSEIAANGIKQLADDLRSALQEVA